MHMYNKTRRMQMERTAMGIKTRCPNEGDSARKRVVFEDVLLLT